MKVIYSGQAIPDTFTKALFLGGPTPRKSDVQSWRPEALSVLELLGYDGVVFIPENPPESGKVFNDWEKHETYDGAVGWEEECLRMADCILFWIPRNLDNMPAFTTNDEWGTWKYSGKTVLGAPDTAPKVKYQKHYAEQLKVPFANTLTKTVKNAVDMVSNGALREKGERFIPLMIWNTVQFQSWLDQQKEVGNHLEGAEVLWNFRVGPEKDFVFAYTIKVNVYVKAEDRYKDNEFVFFRTDISCVVLYRKATDPKDTELVLIKEFRSPVRNKHGFVYEAAGGSSHKSSQNAREVAAQEVFEETGIKLNPGRFRVFKSRQVAATVSTHHAFMYAVELTEEEMAYAKKAEVEGKMFGDYVDGGSEQTYIKVATVDDVLESRLPIDWAMTGMILRAVA